MIGEALARALRVRTHAAGDAGGEHLGGRIVATNERIATVEYGARQPNGTRKGRKNFGR